MGRADPRVLPRPGGDGGAQARLGRPDRSFDGPATAAVTPRLEQLGEYRILREIGHGGMGVVYEAIQESLGRRVA